MTYQDPAPDDGAGVTTVAKEQAGQVGQTAAQAGGQVAQTTKEQAQNVVGEAKQQARDLVGEARTQVRDQAGSQKGRAVQGLRSLADELSQMASQGGQSGMATEVARQVSDRAHGLADHLDRHEPADLLDQFRSYTRRRPAVFLAGAAVAGVLAGRLTRNLASSDDGGPSRQLTGGTTPALPATYDAGYSQSTGYGQPGYGQAGYGQAGDLQAGYTEPGYVQPAGQAGYTQGYVEPAYTEPGYAPSGYAESAPTTAIPATPAYPGGGVETVGYDQPGAYEPEAGTAYDPEAGTAYDPEAGTAYDPEAGTAYDPDSGAHQSENAPRDWRAQ